MDDKEKSQLTTGSIGAVLGGLAGGPAGATIGGAIGGILGGHESDHKATLRDTHYAIYDQVSDSATIHTAHIKPSGAEEGGTGGVLSDAEGEPDLICTDPRGPNLIVEVETLEGIQNDERHALSQLDDFRVRGYKRLLVVPDDELGDAREWVDYHREAGNIGGRLTVTSPSVVEEVI